VIVVDTTVWIDFFNGAQSPEHLHLQQLIHQDRSLALTDLIFCEILQGIRDDAVYARTRRLLLAYPILRMDTLAVFEQSANIYRTCRRQGVTVRKTVDCLIAAVCLMNQVALFHKDADFAGIARVMPLRIHELPTLPS
jgi:predicted nucleic acid-binding protein